MSYAKLFESILDSTVWQEDLHVKVVWITMLAMKDRDGVVEASIPGLAKRAGVSIPQCEEALGKFLAPDVYSRTTDHDGRRIEAVDGGWRLLNADKYRDKLDADDQRRKDAERQQRKRDDLAAKGLSSRGKPSPGASGASGASGRVTLNPDESRRIGHADADTYPEESAPDISPRPEPPDPRAIVRADLGPPPGVPMPGTRERRGKLAMDAWRYAALKHSELKGEGIDPSAIGWGIMPGGEAWDACKARVDEVLAQLGEDAKVADAEAVLRRRIDVAAVEARKHSRLDWFIPIRIWDPKSFAIAASMSPEQAARAGTRPASRGTQADEPAPRRIKTL